MNDFNRKVKDASARVNEKIGHTTEQVEKEAAEFIKYLNDEVVPAVRGDGAGPGDHPRDARHRQEATALTRSPRAERMDGVRRAPWMQL